jgi:hypothetical protein
MIYVKIMGLLNNYYYSMPSWVRMLYIYTFIAGIPTNPDPLLEYTSEKVADYREENSHVYAYT